MFIASNIVSLPYISPNVLLAGISFLVLYLIIDETEQFFNGFMQMATYKKEKIELISFKNLSYAWFDFIKWILIIGGISLIFERTKDTIIMIILYISYFLLYCHLLNITLSWINSTEPLLSQLIEQSDDSKAIRYTKIEKGKTYVVIFNRVFEETPLFRIIDILIKIVIFMLLIGIYVFINEIVIKLQTTGL